MLTRMVSAVTLALEGWQLARRPSLAFVWLPVILGMAAAACERVPLLAPTASTITVSAPLSALPPGGTTEVTAVVMESAGTPVHNGTRVRFSATLGRVEPVEVETRGGIATTTFVAGTASGTAQIRATSGAATGGDGAANVLEIRIGGAAATGVTVSATPSRVPSSGGTVTILALVTDAAGNRLSGVPVTFTTTAGSLSASSVTTDANGEAQVSLTTNREATVTARAGSDATGAPLSATTGVSVGTAPSVELTTSPQEPTAGSPITLTLTPAAGTAPRIVVSWGDGASNDLGVVAARRSVTHTYSSSGHYTISAVATEDGDTFVNSASVTVGSGAAVTLSVPSPSNPVVGSPVTLTVTPATGTTPRVVMHWGDGESTDLGIVSSPRGVAHTYEDPGAYIITATATAGGDTFSTSTAVTVNPRAAIGVNVSANRDGTPQRCQTVTFTAAVTPTTESISAYQWEIASNTASEEESVTTTGNQLTRIFNTTGTKTVTVTAVTPDGRRGTGQTQISVVPETTVVCPAP